MKWVVVPITIAVFGLYCYFAAAVEMVVIPYLAEADVETITASYLSFYFSAAATMVQNASLN